MSTFDLDAAAARFDRRPYQAAGVPTLLYVIKPRVREYMRFLDTVREAKKAQDAGGPGAEFDPEGTTDLTLVRISTVTESGVRAFDSNADVERCLAPAEIVELGMMARDLISPTPNPMTGPAPSSS